MRNADDDGRRIDWTANDSYDLQLLTFGDLSRLRIRSQDARCFFVAHTPVGT